MSKLLLALCLVPIACGGTVDNADSRDLGVELTGDTSHVEVAIVWGYLQPHPGATEWIDWSGRVTADNAALRVIKTLPSEADDVVVRPRGDVHTVEFESHTKPHADGLLLDVIMAPELNPNQLPVTLSFESAPFSDSLRVVPGMILSRVIPVDGSGHVVAHYVNWP